MRAYVTGTNICFHVFYIYTVICDPPCVQGACVDNNTCYCAEAYKGPQCTEPGEKFVNIKFYVCISVKFRSGST